MSARKKRFRPIDPRHLARLLALQVLYEADSSDRDPLPIVENYANMSVPAEGARAASYMTMYSFYTDTIEWGEDDYPPLEESHLLPPPETYQMLRLLILGVKEHQPTLDEIIAEYAPEWPLDQMAIIDRNILRISIYELLFGKNAPVKVVINEAVRIAKLYGADNTHSFVNGVLGMVAEKMDDILADLVHVNDTESPDQASS
jgi:N utilization substance protein B